MQPNPQTHSSLVGKFRLTLESDRLAVVLALLSALAMLPTLGNGLLYDDYYQKRLLEREIGQSFGKPTKLDLFNFADNATQAVSVRIESGELPWWTHPDLRWHASRPLASATHWLDYSLGNGRPWLMHAHSIGWYALTVFCATRLLQRMAHPRWAGGASAVMFAMSWIHCVPVSWVANRNAIMTACFGILTLDWHVRWHVANVSALKSISWGTLSLVLGLLSGEAAVSVVGWIAAYTLILDRSPLRRRALSILPYLVVLVIWLGMYRHGAYGTSNSGYYTDPAGDPLHFATLFLQRMVISLCSVLGWLMADISTFAEPQMQRYLLVYLTTVLAITLFELIRLAKCDRLLLFWSLCTVLALAPLCGAMPMDRTMMLASFASKALIGRFFVLFLQDTQSTRSWKGRSWASWPVLACFLFWHVVITAVLLPIRNESIRRFTEFFTQSAVSASLPEISGKRVVLLNPPDPFYAWYFNDIRQAHGLAVASQVHLLAIGVTSLELTRSDAKTLLVRPESDLLAHPFACLFRDPRCALPTSPIRTQGLDVHVLSTQPNGAPAVIEYQFDVPLDDPTLIWLEWRDGRNLPFQIPAIGQTLRVDRAVPWSFYHLDQTMSVLMGTPSQHFRR